MYRSVFPVQFDSYPNQTTLRGKFVFEDDDDSWTADGNAEGESHTGLTASDAGTGLVSITFPKCKHVQLKAFIDALATTHSSQRVCTFANVNPGAGTATLCISNLAATPAAADPVDASVLHLTAEIHP